MKELIGKICKIQIRCNEKSLFFTAKITEISDTHIFFIDKFQKFCSYRVADIIQIREVGKND